MWQKGIVWICTGEYGPTVVGLRDALWAELDSERARWSSAWCVFGNFNIIKYPVKRLGYISFSPAMFKFSDFIERNFLVDLPLVGVSICGFKNLKILLCLELIEFWCQLSRRITSWM